MSLPESELMQLASLLEKEGRMAYIDISKTTDLNTAGSKGFANIAGKSVSIAGELEKNRSFHPGKVKVPAEIAGMHEATPRIDSIINDIELHSRLEGVRYFVPIDADSLVINIAEVCNKIQIDKKQSTSSLVSLLEQRAELLVQQSEEEMMTLSRFVKQRQALIDNYRMCDQRETLKTLGYSLSNVSRTISTLNDANKVICLAFADKKYFPAFQFSAKGQVHPALLANLPKMINTGKDAWDICFWLVTPKTVLLKSTRPIGKDLVGISLEELKQKASQASNDAEYYQGEPLQALIDGDHLTFNLLTENWLNPESFDLTPSTGVLEGMSGGKDA